jgi:Holliday junction resolvase
LNSKGKGGRGERELVGILRHHGYDSKRNDQRYIGGLENPDVSLPGCHIEVKRTEKLRLYDAMDQAVRDANGKTLPVQESLPLACNYEA